MSEDLKRQDLIFSALKQTSIAFPRYQEDNDELWQAFLRRKTTYLSCYLNPYNTPLPEALFIKALTFASRVKDRAYSPNTEPKSYTYALTALIESITNHTVSAIYEPDKIVRIVNGKEKSIEINRLKLISPAYERTTKIPQPQKFAQELKNEHQHDTTAIMNHMRSQIVFRGVAAILLTAGYLSWRPELIFALFDDETKRAVRSRLNPNLRFPERSSDENEYIFEQLRKHLTESLPGSPPRPSWRDNDYLQALNLLHNTGFLTINPNEALNQKPIFGKTDHTRQIKAWVVFSSIEEEVLTMLDSFLLTDHKLRKNLKRQLRLATTTKIVDAYENFFQ